MCDLIPTVLAQAGYEALKHFERRNHSTVYEKTVGSIKNQIIREESIFQQLQYIIEISKY